jgi:hypothetical protein
MSVTREKSARRSGVARAMAEIVPLALAFDAEVNARLWEGRLHRPTPYQVTDDLADRQVYIRAKQRLRSNAALGVAYE